MSATISYLLFIAALGAAFEPAILIWANTTIFMTSSALGAFGGTVYLRQFKFAMQLKQELQYDTLTGAKSRHYFFNQIMRRGLKRDVMVMIDVDRFKAINDSYGHILGDKVLAHIGRVLTQNARAEDIVCRFGGEEFAILLHDLSSKEAFELTERLRATLAGEKIRLDDNREISVTASFGVAAAQPDDTIDLALKRADTALYRAKLEGRNKVIVAVPSDDPGMAELMEARAGPKVAPLVTF